MVQQAALKEKTAFSGKDYAGASVTQIFNDLLEVLKHENPGIVRQMVADGQITTGIDGLVPENDERADEAQLEAESNLELMI